MINFRDIVFVLKKKNQNSEKKPKKKKKKKKKKNSITKVLPYGRESIYTRQVISTRPFT